VKGRAVLHRIPVEGGSLAVDVLTADTTPALALHGVSSNRELWNWVHAQAPGSSLITPDLRGRADSTGITGLMWNLSWLGCQLMITVQWERYPLVDQHVEAHRWLQFTANIGRAWNTVDAYGRAWMTTSRSA
jgi:hypothetical protein